MKVKSDADAKEYARERCEILRKASQAGLDMMRRKRESQWRSVKDSLPLLREKVLVIEADGSQSIAARYQYNAWIAWEEVTTLDHGARPDECLTPTHWMPLPDPPGAERPKPPEPRYDDVHDEGVAAMEADLPPPLKPGDVLLRIL